LASNEHSPVTQLLKDWRGGDAEALGRLLPHVYDELRRLARRHMRGERGDHTLQTTGLVHEAYVRLVHSDVPWEDRVHFFAVAAGLMRRILVDHAKANRRQKRGGGARRITLDEAALVSSPPGEDLLQLDRALDGLAELDARKSRIVELVYFGGMTYREAAAALEISEATVHRELRIAKAWLVRAIGHGNTGGS
jgi:RNA polymerase sigma factor (TIGR02999 family)